MKLSYEEKAEISLNAVGAKGEWAPLESRTDR